MNKGKMKKMILATAAVLGITFVGLKIVAAITKKNRYFAEEPKQQNPLEGKKVVFVEDENDIENADGVKGHLEAIGESEHRGGCYDRYIKRGMDVVLSFFGLIFLAPVIAGIAIAIKIDDPGPVFFTQKRLGQNKKYFKLYKFRSMKMCTPHDVPTHMLENPEQYITKVGKFIRAHSLDELPQIFNVFAGDMSLVGPRPGLWNQDVLTAERDKYGANDVKPGITGWAQINGRDAIEIPVKAALDGEYVKKESLLFDLKCLLGTVSKVGHDDSVVEGGTGEMKRVYRNYTDGKSDKELIGHIGFGEPVEIEKEGKKKILITGAGSYIGESFKQYASENYAQNFEIDEIDMLSEKWREADFSAYDIVYHVAGIAHADVGNVSEETKQKYYAVNTDLAIDVAKKAKEAGVKEFIFMSSMIVYGDSAPYGKKKVVDENTVPTPANFYGNSKIQADVAVRELADENFKVIVLRPPMIYGKGSKGNYPTLAKIAKKLPVFPNVNNQRSMLYIDNLCEFLCQIMLIKEVKQNATVLIPQNAEWTKTTEMVKEIARVSGKGIVELKILALAVAVGSKIPGKIGGVVNKAFGNSCYAHDVSEYEGINYQKISLNKSIEYTESEYIGTEVKKVKIVQLFKIYWPDNGGGIARVIENISSCLDKWNQEDESVDIEQEIVVCQSDASKKSAKDKYKGVDVYRCKQIIDVASTPISTQFLYAVRKHTKNADIVIYHFPYPMIDLASMLGFIKGKVVIWWHCDYDTGNHKTISKFYGPLVRRTLKRADKIIVSAQGNIDGCPELLPYKDKCVIIPFAVEDEWADNGKQYFEHKQSKSAKKVNVLFLGRFVWYKGIDYLLEAYARLDQSRYSLTLVGDGPLLDEMKSKAKKLHIEDITFVGSVSDEDKANYIKKCDFMVLPSVSKAEAFAIVQIEAMAYGKPVINTDLPSGVPDVCPNGIAGITIKPENVEELYEAMKKLGEDEKLRQEYGRNAIKIIAENNTMEKMKEKHRMLFNSMLN